MSAAVIGGLTVGFAVGLLDLAGDSGVVSLLDDVVFDLLQVPRLVVPVARELLQFSSAPNPQVPGGFAGDHSGLALDLVLSEHSLDFGRYARFALHPLPNGPTREEGHIALGIRRLHRHPLQLQCALKIIKVLIKQLVLAAQVVQVVVLAPQVLDLALELAVLLEKPFGLRDQPPSPLDGVAGNFAIGLLNRADVFLDVLGQSGAYS